MAGEEDLAERVRLIESSLPTAFAGHVLCLATATALLHGTIPWRLLGPWLTAQLAIGAWRASTVLSRSPAVAARRSLRGRHRAAIAHAALTGLMWGLFGHVAVASGDTLATLVAVMIATGLLGGATALIGHLSSVYLPYALPVAALPAAGLLTREGAHDLRWVGALLLTYLLFSLVAARGNRALVGESIALRFHNAHLIDWLKRAHRRTDNQRRRTAEALERERRANLAKSRFLAAASHDLRQPLHSLRLHVTTLESGARGAEHEASARLISRSVGALEELFDAILDVSKLDAGALSPVPRAVALGSLLDALVEEMRPQAAARGMTLRAESGAACVRTDPVLFSRLLQNLVANALRHAGTGEVLIRARRREDGGLEVQVADTGPGIAPEARERVFEEFVQLKNPERDRGRGIGLGLSIVRRIGDLLGLEVRIGDTSGGGTTVTVSIPSSAVTERAPAAPEPTPEREPSGVARADGLTVLVIDDEKGVRDATAAFLETHGCSVLAADSAEESFAQLDRFGDAPDAIVCDFRLRGDERGTETVRRVRERCGSEVPAVIVTGDVAAERLREIGASGLHVLHKPCDPYALLGLLRGAGAGGAETAAQGAVGPRARDEARATAGA